MELRDSIAEIICDVSDSNLMECVDLILKEISDNPDHWGNGCPIRGDSR